MSKSLALMDQSFQILRVKSAFLSFVGEIELKEDLDGFVLGGCVFFDQDQLLETVHGMDPVCCTDDVFEFVGLDPTDKVPRDTQPISRLLDQFWSPVFSEMRKALQKSRLYG